MALSIGDNFKYQGKKPNFERDTFATKADMKAFPEANIDEGHVSFCVEDGQHYEYKSNNIVDSVTGKWKLYLDDYALKDDVSKQIKNVDDKFTNVPTNSQLEEKFSSYSTTTQMNAEIVNHVTEYNVSKHHPTAGIGGSNKFTLAEAIKLIPQDLQSVGIKCSFLKNADNEVKTYVYQGGTFTDVASWKLEKANIRESDSINISSSNIVYGFYIRKDGDLLGYTGASCTQDTLTIPVGALAVYYSGRYGQEAAAVVFLDSSNKVISAVTNPQITTVSKMKIQIPDTAIYMKASTLNQTLDIEYENILKKVSQMSDDYKQIYEDCRKNTQIRESVTVQYEYSLNMAKGYYNRLLELKTDQSDFVCSKFDLINQIGNTLSLHFSLPKDFSAKTAIVTDDGSVRTFLSTSNNTNTGSVEVVSFEVLKGDKELYISSFNNPGIKLVGPKIPTEEIKQLKGVIKKVTENSEKVQQLEQQNNYLYNKKILVVGDSMVQGHSVQEVDTWLAKIAIRNNMVRYNKGTNGAYMTNRQYNSKDNSVYQKICIPDSEFYITDDVLSQMDYILIYAATNDCSQNVPIGLANSVDPSELCGALNLICEKLQTRAPQAHIGFITPQLRMSVVDRCWTFIDAIENVCKKYSIPVFNQGKNCGINWSNNAIVDRLTLKDSFHLNKEGMEFISYKYESFIRRI